MTVQEDLGEWFALDGPLAQAVETVLTDLLPDKVEVTRRESMVGKDRYTSVFQTKVDDPFLMWSNGEYLIWQFCRSLAGGTGINLHLLAGAVGGQHNITPRLVALFAMSMDR